MKISIRIVAVTFAWAALLWAALRVAHLHTPWDHALCGVWGCGPTLPAIVSCHFAWLTVLIPIALMGRHLVPTRWIQSIGLAGSVLVLAILVGIVSGEATTWLRQAPEGYGRHFVQRCLFVIATWIDVPVIELGFVSVFWWMTPDRLRHKRADLLKSVNVPGTLQPVEISKAHDCRRN